MPALGPEDQIKDQRDNRDDDRSDEGRAEAVDVQGHRVGEPDRDCEVLDVRGTDGGPPYVVRWADSGHETLFFPGSDAMLQHFEHLATGGKRP